MAEEYSVLTTVIFVFCPVVINIASFSFVSTFPSNLHRDPGQFYTFVSCQDSEACLCPGGIVECVCKEGYDRLYYNESSHLHVLPESIKSISIRNCSTVIIHTGALIRYANLENVSIHDVGELSLHLGLQPFSAVKNLVIESAKNVSLLQITALRMKSLIIQNSNIGTMDNETLRIYFLNNVIINNCTFDTLKPGSLYMMEVKTFHMINTTINTIWTNAVRVGGEEIIYQSTHFRRTQVANSSDNGILTIYSAKNLTIYNCTFDWFVDTKSMFKNATRKAKQFRFENNTVKRMAKETFHGAFDPFIAPPDMGFPIYVTDNLTFINNRIFQAELDSLVPNKYANFSRATFFRVQDNLFSCDFVNMSWIWTDDLYEILLNTSKCFAPNVLNGVALSSISPEVLYNISTEYISKNSFVHNESEEMVKFCQDCSEFENSLSEEEITNCAICTTTDLKEEQILGTTNNEEPGSTTSTPTSDGGCSVLGSQSRNVYIYITNSVVNIH